MERSTLLRGYERDLKAAWRGASTDGRVVVAPTEGLFRRRPSAHFHHTPELFFQTGGACTFITPGGKFVLERGDLAVIPAGVPHQEVPMDRKTPYGVVVIMAHGHGVAFIRGATNVRGAIIGQDILLMRKGGEIFAFLEVAIHGAGLNGRERDAFRRASVGAFLGRSLDVLRGEMAGSDKEVLRPTLSEAAASIVGLELSQVDLSVASIAERLGCTPDHLSRCFRVTHKMTLGVYLKRERLRLARRLLAESPRAISEIGWLCGFRSPSYFVRVFREATGTTPGLWAQVKRRATVSPATEAGEGTLGN